MAAGEVERGRARQLAKRGVQEPAVRTREFEGDFAHDRKV